MKKMSIVLVLLLCLSLCGCKEAAVSVPAQEGVQSSDTIINKTALSVKLLPCGPLGRIPWVANCEEYITLWDSPLSDEIITTIPKGEKLTLLKWDGRYALVAFGEEKGYVNSAYIMPADAELFAKCLNTVTPTDTYSYEQMLEDVNTFSEKYPELVETETVGQSELGRDIPVLRIGDVNAEKHVFIQGSIHGREHMTAWCIMAMIDYWLDNGLEQYEDICWHVIPMINPDGVVISQTGELTEEQLKIYDSDLALEFFPEDMTEYTAQWKANGRGVDINRNFPAGWEYIDDITEPSAAFFKGETEFSTAEARILRDYTLRYDFDVTISYHSSGSIIYWQYGTKQPVNELSYELGEAVNIVTGYPLIGSESVVGAGYKDWAINSLEIPSLTIEIGSGDSPLDERELYSVFARNYMVLPAVAGWLEG